MSASIVYEGVGGGGSLFAGKKYFFLQRVPSRSHYVDLVKSNGGEIVKLEKNADIIIADHARKDAPRGSTSWKFVEESAKAGKLMDIRRYRLGASGPSPSPAPPARQNNKTTRTPFTKEDDHLLTQWVTKADRKGLPTKGNDIYIQLAENYPHHTYQSWRDRWVKILLPRRRNISSEEPDDDNLPSPQIASKPTGSTRAATRSQKSEPPVQPSRSRAPTRTHQVQPSAISIRPGSSHSRPTSAMTSPTFPISPKKSRKGMVFTEKETELLREAYDDILDVDPVKEIDAWETWTETHGGHSAQEWRNYFHEDFKPREQARLEEERVAKEKKKRHPPPPPRNHQKSPKHSLPKPIDSDHSIGPDEFNSVRDPHGKQSRISSVATASSRRADTRVDSKPSPTVKVKKRPKKSVTEEEFNKAREMCLNDQEYFETNLANYLNDDQELEPYPLICNKEISLFELWKLVQSFGGYASVTSSKAWPRIANKLRYKPALHAKAAKELEDCYVEVLRQFEDDVAHLAPSDLAPEEFTDDEEEAENLIQTQILGEEKKYVRRESGSYEDESYDEENDDGSYQDDLDLPSTSNMALNMRLGTEKNLKRQVSFDDELSEEVAGDKRQRQISSDDGLSWEVASKKRQKVHKGKGREREIPSTPDDIINGMRNHIEEYQSSPLKNAKTITISRTASPANLENKLATFAIDLVQNILETDAEDIPSSKRNPSPKTNGQQSKPKLKPKPNSIIIEPETQDFHYPEPPSGDEDSSIFSDNVERPTAKANPSLESESEFKSSSESPESEASVRQNPKSQLTKGEEKKTDQELEDFIKSSIDLGYSAKIVHDALAATTFEPEDARVVMEFLKNRKGVPDNMIGVWTLEDDDALEEDEYSEEYERIVEKHGEERIQTRKDFLNDYMTVKKIY